MAYFNSYFRVRPNCRPDRVECGSESHPSEAKSYGRSGAQIWSYSKLSQDVVRPVSAQSEKQCRELNGKVSGHRTRIKA